MRLLLVLVVLTTTTVFADTPPVKEMTFTKGPCAGMKQFACAKLATRYELGVEGVKKDLQRGFEIEVSMCDQGLLVACTSAAELSVDLPDDRRRELYKKGCVAPEGPGCLLFAYWLDDHAGRDEAKKMFERACAAASADSCKRRGDYEPDGPVALGWYKKACVLGDDDACGKLGRALLNDEAGVSAAEGTKALEDLCDQQKIAIGCSFAAMRHFEGKGAARASREDELVWWRKGCELAGDMQQCFLLGTWYAENAKVDTERALARKYLEMSCAGEVQRACETIDRLKKKAKR